MDNSWEIRSAETLKATRKTSIGLRLSIVWMWLIILLYFSEAMGQGFQKLFTFVTAIFALYFGS